MKKVKRKVNMWKHRASYWADRNPEELGFWVCMAGLFISQILIALVS